MSEENTAGEPTADEAIRTVVARLARPHPRGAVIERAAILAEGPSSTAIVEWIIDHDGEPESAQPAKASLGLHGGRLHNGETGRGGAPQRYVLPAGTLSAS